MARQLTPAEAALALKYLPAQKLSHLLGSDEVMDTQNSGYSRGTTGDGHYYEVTATRVRVRMFDGPDVLNVPISVFRATRAASSPRLLEQLDEIHAGIAAQWRPGWDHRDLGRKAALAALYKAQDEVVEELLTTNQDSLL